MKHILRNLFSIFSLVLISNTIIAQTLFTIDGESVTVREFERVYTKNNINNQADYSKASLDEYLDLYVKFRLKVKEAETLQMDTLKPLQDELATYRKQLAKNYLKDKEVNDGLVAEAYDRSQYEVDASHILIAWPNEIPSTVDSATVLKEITALKKKAKASNFSDLAKKNSDDPSAVNNGGRLGYLTVFQTVYPFESAMYNTEVGKISEPVATRFGYHLVLVHDKRPARGKMTTAHILIKSKDSDTDDVKASAKSKAEEVYKKLTSEEVNFTVAAKQYSEDKKTKFKGGALPALTGSEMINEYAEAAYALEKDGDFSAPVKTSIGWHIIQRLSIADSLSFEDAEEDLKKRVERDSRSQVAEEIMIADTKKQFGFKNNATAKANIIAALAKGFDKGKFNLENQESYNTSLFSIGKETYTQNDFVSYVEKFFQRSGKQSDVSPVLESYYQKFEVQMLSKYREAHLEEINEDFKNLMQEYHDGILLFELTNNEVWNKAVADTAGLKKFHEEHKEDYMWEERVDYTTYTTKNEKAAIKLKKFLGKNLAQDKIVSKLNKKEDVVKVKNYKKELDENGLVKDLEWKKGAMVESTNADGLVSISVVNKILDPMPKLLSETRGYVISDYQDFLEKNWVAGLQKKYEVVVNEDVFKSLIKN